MGKLYWLYVEGTRVILTRLVHIIMPFLQLIYFKKCEDYVSVTYCNE